MNHIVWTRVTCPLTKFESGLNLLHKADDDARSTAALAKYINNLRQPIVGNRTIRYDTRCYFNVRSKADMSQLNLPRGNNN